MNNFDVFTSSDSHRINGRIINDGVATQCKKCKGERGWERSNGNLKHLECGTIQ